MKQKLNTLLKRISAPWLRLIPVSLPQSNYELDVFIARILELGGYPANNSFRHAIATQVLHLNSDVQKVAPRVFLNAIRRSVANQVSYDLVQAIKEDDKREKTVQQMSADKTSF